MITFTILTTAGIAWLIDKVQDVVATKQQYIGWGTGAGAEAIGNTALTTEASEARTLGTLSQPIATTDRLVGTITATGTKTITEVGRFDAATAGVMLMRALFTGIPMLNGDSVIFTLDYIQS